MPGAKVAGGGNVFLPLSGGALSGALTTTVLTATGNVTCGATQSFYVNGRFLYSAIGVGKGKLVNHLGTAGVVVDVTTSGKLNLRDLADTAPGGLACAGGDVKEVLLASETMDLNSTAKQQIYQVPTGKTLIVTKVVMRGPSATPSGTVRGGLGGDSNATNFTTSCMVHAVTATNNVYIYFAAQAYPAYAAGTVFGFKATTPEGSALEMEFDLFGYLI